MMRDHSSLDAASATVSSPDPERLGPEQLTKLAAQDDRLLGIESRELEGWHARVDRLAFEAQARAEADKLSAEALRRGDEEVLATQRAREAELQAEEAHRAHQDAEVRAREAHAEAGLRG